MFTARYFAPLCPVYFTRTSKPATSCPRLFTATMPACLPACLFPLLYVSSLFQFLSRARTRSTVSFLDVCFDRLSFLLIFVKIGYNFGYDYNFRFLTKIPNTNLLFVDCSRIEYDYPIQFSSRNILKYYKIRLLD